MTKTEQDIKNHNAGDALDIVDEITEEETGNLLDVSGYSAQFTLAEYRGGPVVLQYDDTDGRFTFTDAPNGKVTCSLDASDTEDLEGDYYYEIELEDAKPHTVTTGSIEIVDSY